MAQQPKIKLPNGRTQLAELVLADGSFCTVMLPTWLDIAIACGVGGMPPNTNGAMVVLALASRVCLYDGKARDLTETGAMEADLIAPIVDVVSKFLQSVQGKGIA